MWAVGISNASLGQFDHRNGSMLQDWLVNEYAGSAATGLANPNIDGSVGWLGACRHIQILNSFLPFFGTNRLSASLLMTDGVLGPLRKTTTQSGIWAFLLMKSRRSMPDGQQT